MYPFGRSPALVVVLGFFPPNLIQHVLPLSDAATEYEEVSAGETVFQAGDRGDVFYVLMEGRLSVLEGNPLAKVRCFCSPLLTR